MSSLVVISADDETVTWTLDRPPAVVPDPAGSRLSLPERTERHTDVFGFPPAGLTRRVPVRTELAFSLELVAPDCPLGPARSRISVTGSGRLTSHTASAGAREDSAEESAEASDVDHEPMFIMAPYCQLLRWLHRDTIFGHLLWSGADIRGDLLDFAALDGIVSAPAEPSTASVVIDTLIELTGPCEQLNLPAPHQSR